MKKKLILLAVLAVLSICLPTQGQPWSGSGTEGDPYLIEDANDMQAIGADPNYWDAHFLLVNDINLADYNGTDLNLIGLYFYGADPCNRAFKGVFDGSGHTIKNLSYTCTGMDGIGLFQYLDDGGRIKDLVLDLKQAYLGVKSWF